MVFEPNRYQSKSFSEAAYTPTLRELANRSRPSKSNDCCSTQSSRHFHLDHREVEMISILPEHQQIAEELSLLTKPIKKRKGRKRQEGQEGL